VLEPGSAPRLILGAVEYDRSDGSAPPEGEQP
jgi:hypothetical protein